MKIKKSVLLAFAIAGTSVQAQNIISWTYNNGNAIPANGFAGVVSTTNWTVIGNDSDGAGPFTLIYNNGLSSGTSLTLAGGFGAWGIGGVSGPDANGTYNKSLFDGYYNLINGTLSLGNIPFANYDVYVYFSSDSDGRTGTISDGATTYSFSTVMRNQVDNDPNVTFMQTTDTGSGNPNANYAVFSGLSGASQTFTINGSDGMGFAGIQIVAVPEPTTLALAGVGGFGVFIVRRRMSKS